MSEITQEYLDDLKALAKRLMESTWNVGDEEMIATAVPALIVEVERLMADNANLRAKVDRRTNRLIEMMRDV
jgi:hypothetical protein